MASGLPEYSELKDSELGVLYSQCDHLAYHELWTRHEEWLGKRAMRESGHNQQIGDEAIEQLHVKLALPGMMKKYAPRGGNSWRAWAGTVQRHIVYELLAQRVGPQYVLTRTAVKKLKSDGLPAVTLSKLDGLIKKQFWTEASFHTAVGAVLTAEELNDFYPTIRERARRTRKQAGPFDEEVYRVPDDRGTSPEPDEFLAEFGKAADECLAKLPPEQRAIFILHVRSGLTFASIAETLYGVKNANRTAPLYYEALKSLRDCLSKFRRPTHDSS